MAEPTVAAAPHAQAVYNPAPPVKPVAKKATGCMGIIAGLVVLAAPALYLVAALLH
jgi:hypothetical protein